MLNNLIIWGVCAVLVGGMILKAVWRELIRRWDERDELRRLASDAAAAAGVKYANEHPRELHAAIYCDGTAEDAASYRKGQRAAEEAAYKAVLADPVEARAAARWEASAAKIREAKGDHSAPSS